MSNVEYKKIIDRSLDLLRKKKNRGENDKVNLNEIINSFTYEERDLFKTFNHKYYLNELNEYLKNNPKINFDPNTKIFSFNHKFYGPNDLINKLYNKKIGIVENQDLYDDIDKNDIIKLKKGNIFREIEIEERKTKPKIVVLFAGDELDDAFKNSQLEKKSSNFLKKYWNDLNIIKKNETKNVTLNSLNKTNKKNLKNLIKKKINKNDKNFFLWKNNHLVSRIEKAFKEIEEKNK